MKPGHSLMKHYLQFKDLRAEEYAYLFERARIIKQRFKNYERYQPLADRTLAMIFEKASTRTRVSFEAGMYQMGGSVVHLTTDGSQLGRAEPIDDSARVISRMVDIVMIRTYEQTKIERFAAHSRVPVINGLTNEYHPCRCGLKAPRASCRAWRRPGLASGPPWSGRRWAIPCLATAPGAGCWPATRRPRFPRWPCWCRCSAWARQRCCWANPCRAGSCRPPRW